MKDSTDVIFILDASGSMYDLKEDVIGGFNSTIEELKKENENILVSLVTFNTDVSKVYERRDIKDIVPLRDEDYVPGGCTALLDAVGSLISRFSSLKEDEKSSKVIMYITTDGYENSSKEYNYSMIRHMIEFQKKKEGWDINFLAGNIDVNEERDKLGIDESNAASFDITPDGMKKEFKYMAKDCSMKVRKKKSSDKK